MMRVQSSSIDLRPPQRIDSYSFSDLRKLGQNLQRQNSLLLFSLKRRPVPEKGGGRGNWLLTPNSDADYIRSCCPQRRSISQCMGMKLGTVRKAGTPASRKAIQLLFTVVRLT